ncbi:unnamed protein product [Linum tenue]|uniref:VQ domain-containing protein n=1 Tax=Linum tenue TaxID=586396 RepID=A0AAV0ITZ0_9ROSI|nr:unnamed protein product [Linum tenue]
MRQTTTTHSFLHDGHPQSYNNHEATTLKVNKDSHAILKNSSSASSLAVAGSAKPPPQRHPVIIYTHSPKVIHTHPKDFMALVQKLTGLSRSDHDPDPARWDNAEEDTRNTSNSNHHNNNNNNNDDNDSSSVITEENGHQQLNSSSSNCFLNNPSSVFESPPPPNPYHRQLPAAAADRLNLYPPFFGYADPLLFGTSPAFRTLDAINDHFPEFS